MNWIDIGVATPPEEEDVWVLTKTGTKLALYNEWEDIFVTKYGEGIDGVLAWSLERPGWSPVEREFIAKAVLTYAKMNHAKYPLLTATPEFVNRVLKSLFIAPLPTSK